MRHFLTLKDFSTREILQIVKRSLELKSIVKKQICAGIKAPALLGGTTMAMIFSKKSTRTRVSADAGFSFFGGNALFLSHNDLQLGGGESIKDTVTVISSMTDLIFARLGHHDEITEMAKYSSVPVVNALTAKYHPLQILADLMTIYENYLPNCQDVRGKNLPLPDLPPLNICWIGDANNIVNSMLVTYPRLGLNLSIATPPGYIIDTDVMEFAKATSRGKLSFHSNPTDAARDANIVITDTWISMGDELDFDKRIRDFEGFQITEKLCKVSHPDWKFMHCLPRKKYEVDDEVLSRLTKGILQQQEVTCLS